MTERELKARCKRLAIDCLIVTPALLGLLWVGAYADRDQEDAINKVLREQTMQSSPYEELDQQARQMVAYEEIRK